MGSTKSPRVCLLFPLICLFTIGIEGRLYISPLPQGLLHSTQTVKEICATYKVTVVFDPDYLLNQPSLLQEITQLKALFKDIPELISELTRQGYFIQELNKLQSKFQPLWTHRALEFIELLGRNYFLLQLKKISMYLNKLFGLTEKISVPSPICKESLLALSMSLG